MLPQSVRTRIQENFPAMLDTLSGLIAIPSVAVPTDLPGAPYGVACAQALGLMLGELEQLGMTCTNYDGHMGAADWDASLAPYLGILCHLDVVPATASQWRTDPFRGEIIGDRLYGRGAIDDKGPAVCVLYALRALRESGVTLGRGLRFLLGCNEENGSSDLAYYRSRAQLPPHVFTPDGSYPLIHLEKGMLRLTITAEVPDALLGLQGGAVPNAVPAFAQATLADGTTQSYTGQAAHASTPEQGDNAITGLLRQLSAQDPAAYPGCAALARLFPHGCIDGGGLGVACADPESGSLTCVLSMLNLAQGQLTGCVDIRYPLATTGRELLAAIRTKLAAAGFGLEVILQSDPHHTPQDSPLVQQLLQVYQAETGTPGQCLAIGGGTYVHDIPGGVAFGMEWPGWDYHMHGDDEFIPLSQLRDNTEMMAAAIYALCAQ